MAAISIQARHADGFSSELLRWSLAVRDDVGRVEAVWFEYGAPGHRRSRTATFPFPTEWIVPLFDVFAALESDYDSLITDSQTEDLTLKADDREKRCRVYAGDIVLRDHPEIAPFYRIWTPIKQAVLQALDLPFRQPKT
jgi:hypothetical protein